LTQKGRFSLGVEQSQISNRREVVKSQLGGVIAVPLILKMTFG